MKKVYYRKLIRDKIPEKIIGKGSKLETKKLNKAQFELELRRKLMEETQELQNAKCKQDITSELADIVDVIEELKKIRKIIAKDIANAQKMKRVKNGGFKKRLFLIWSSQDDYNSKSKSR